MDQPSAPQQTYGYRGEGEHLTDSMRIAALLKKVKDSRTLIQATLPGRTREYNSAPLDRHPKQGYPLPDEVTPAAGHQFITTDSRLTATIRLRGIDMSFTRRSQEISGQSHNASIIANAAPITG